ncbi:uncharacterized protein B0H64DRAFT_441503 [Chaetomium fimeti]|uniref:Uncharacterized protein n=1 Tax=Chaetomium fimeti TaxID=1854472 RepID=A0AAE0HK87_9PEZI|nr:hypothetical protein B0H64DRAFT_441503 [Chaetomium fimeti]
MQWQGRFDPSWYLIILISRSVLDPVIVESSETRALKSNAAAGPLDSMRVLRRAIDAESGTTVANSARLELDAGRFTNIHETQIMRYTSAKVMVQAGSGDRLVTEPVDLSTVISPQSITLKSLLDDCGTLTPIRFVYRCEGILRKMDPQSGRLTALEVVYCAPSTR